MSVASYEAKFYLLSRYVSYFLKTEKERIHHFMKKLNIGLQISSLQMTFSGWSFQKIVDFVKKVKDVRQKGYAKALEKRLIEEAVSILLFLRVRVHRDTLLVPFHQHVGVCRWSIRS